MNQVHVKIHSWEEDSKSLIISFASDTTSSSNPDSYEALAYQPHLFWPDVTDSAELMKKIGQLGIGVCEQIERDESVNDNADMLTVYSGLSGQTQTFNTADIADPAPTE